MTTSSVLHPLTIGLALAGAALALLAVISRIKGWLANSWVNRLYTLSYCFLGASVLTYVLRGLIGR